MKANELMIGDWVHLKYRHYLTREVVEFDFKVSQLPCNYGNEIQVWGDSIDGKHHGNMGDVSRIDPIPLTPDILEKNGVNDDGEGVYGNDDSFFIPTYQSGFDTGTWETHIEPTEGIGDFHGKLRYVHELQHALRLCGIDKAVRL